MSERERVVERKCRWCGETFRVPPDYPNRQGCPECAPRLELELAGRSPEAPSSTRERGQSGS